MSALTIALICVIGLFVLVLLGVHIAFSLAVMSFIGVVLIQGSFDTGISILATTTFEAVRNYTFAVIPLFMLMGAFMSNSPIAKNLFTWCGYLLKKVPGGLGVATVFANAVFAAVTGVAIASAAIFGKIAVPEMARNHFKSSFAAGTVAGSSVLGMLIPPSLMFILYGMLAEVSIGKMFMAGIIPGLLLAVMFSVLVMLLAKVRPDYVYEEGYQTKAERTAAGFGTSAGGQSFGKLSISVIPTIILILLILGGIWLGWFTPTEAAAVGAAGALIIAISLGMRWKNFRQALLDTAGSTSSVLFLIITATMYSRMLTVSGAISWINTTIIGLGVNKYIVLFLCLLLILALGCVLDSSSILLITAPLMVPIMTLYGFDLVWFGVVMVLVVHMGLVTPPFGICVFSVKSAINAPISVETIFARAMPFLVVMLIHVLIIILIPVLSTWLPSIM